MSARNLFVTSPSRALLSSIIKGCSPARAPEVASWSLMSAGARGATRLAITRHDCRSLLCEPRTCGDGLGFPAFSRRVIKTSTLLQLRDAAARGAVAGLLIEASHPDVEMLFWLPWHHLCGSHCDSERFLPPGRESPLIHWGDTRLVPLCPASTTDRPVQLISLFEDVPQFRQKRLLSQGEKLPHFRKSTALHV